MKTIIAVLTGLLVLPTAVFASNDDVDINAIQAAITPPLNYVRDNKVEGQPLFHLEPGVFSVYHADSETIMVIEVPVVGGLEGEREWAVFILDKTHTLSRI